MDQESGYNLARSCDSGSVKWLQSFQGVSGGGITSRLIGDCWQYKVPHRTLAPHRPADQWLSPVLCHMGHSIGSSQGKRGWARRKLESFSNLILEVVSITFAVFYTLKDFTRFNPLTGGGLERTWVSGGRHYGDHLRRLRVTINAFMNE